MNRRSRNVLHLIKTGTYILSIYVPDKKKIKNNARLMHSCITKYYWFFNVYTCIYWHVHMFFIRQTIIYFTFPQTVTRRVLYKKRKKKKKKKRDHCHNLNTNTLINVFFFISINPINTIYETDKKIAMSLSCLSWIILQR